MLPLNTAKILEYLFPAADADTAWVVESANGTVRIARWNLPDPQPSETLLVNTAASTAFQNWLAEHGGDVIKTRRGTAKQRLDLSIPDVIFLRAAFRVLYFALVETREKVNEVINAVNAANGTSIALLANRTWEQVKQTTRAEIDSGEADE